MTRRLPLFLVVALAAATLLATAPLAAQTPEPQPHDHATPAEPMPEDSDEAEVGERMERSEEGTLEGSIVLLDADNLIVETSDGDRAFSIRETSQLPDELRDAAAWASYRGVPVRVTFAPGDEGELRVVRSLTLTGDGTATTTTTTTTTDTAATGTTAARTDLGDESDVVEPTDPAATSDVTSELTATTVRTDDEGATATTTTTTTTTDGRTTGQAIADANDDDMDEMDAAAGFAAADDDLPPGERMASLPATASPLPWLALIGTLALLAALGLGRLESLRRRPATQGNRR